MGNIKKITHVGNIQTYDLEVNHKDHQFYMSNGMLTSNSHAVLYSMLSYKEAYLKAHYPLEFLLANLKTEIRSNTKDAPNNVAKIKKELLANGIRILPPNLNSSKLTYSIHQQENDKPKLLTGLDALKFVSDDAIKDIIEKRPFNSFFDFMSRVSSKYVRANAIQALAASGALDIFGIPRKLIYLYVSDYRKKFQVWIKKHDPSKEDFNYPWPTEPEWTKPEIYALERFYLGEAFVCGKIDAYGNFFKEKKMLTIGDIKKLPDKTKIPSMKVEVKDFFEFKVKKEKSKYQGKSMIKAVIEDINGEQCSLTVFPDRWELIQNKIKKTNSKFSFEEGIALHFGGVVNVYEEELGIILDELYSFLPPPQVPVDLVAKKVNLKVSKKEDKSIIDTSNNQDNLFEEIEDALYDEGLIDLDEDYENNDD